MKEGLGGAIIGRGVGHGSEAVDVILNAYIFVR